MRRLKKEIPALLVVTDVCLDEYTSHGHCGVIVDGEVDNDATLPLLAEAPFRTRGPARTSSRRRT